MTRVRYETEDLGSELPGLTVLSCNACAPENPVGGQRCAIRHTADVESIAGVCSDNTL